MYQTYTAKFKKGQIVFDENPHIQEETSVLVVILDKETRKKSTKKTAFGCLSQYANKERIEKENNIWKESVKDSNK